AAHLVPSVDERLTSAGVGGDGMRVGSEGGGQDPREIGDAQAGAGRAAQRSAGRNELLVQALAVSADDDEAAVRGQYLLAHRRVLNADTRGAGEAALPAVVTGAPHLRAQQPGGHRD